MCCTYLVGIRLFQARLACDSTKQLQCSQFGGLWLWAYLWICGIFRHSISGFMQSRMTGGPWGFSMKLQHDDRRTWPGSELLQWRDSFPVKVGVGIITNIIPFGLVVFRLHLAVVVQKMSPWTQFQNRVQCIPAMLQVTVIDRLLCLGKSSFGNVENPDERNPFPWKGLYGVLQ